jgi:hypothetical protein
MYLTPSTPQIAIDNLIPNVSVFNLALNVAGIINNKKNVSIYTLDEKGIKTDILEGKFGILSNLTNILGQSPIIENAEIIETSKLAEHPLEDGKVTADTKVKMPTEITVKIVMPAVNYQDYISAIKEIKDNNIPLYVETKYGVFDNMQIVGIPVSLTVENISNITFTLKLREVLVAEDLSVMSYDKVANINDASNKKLGLKTGTEVNRLNLFGI